MLPHLRGWYSRWERRHCFRFRAGWSGPRHATMHQFLAKTAFAAIAWPVVLRASLRAAWNVRRLPLDEVVTTMRSVKPLPGWLQRPRWLAGLSDRLLPVLPPLGYGPCMKRSLFLLDLWGRCGLEPVIHLGIQTGDQSGQTATASLDATDRELHAWITAGQLSTPSNHTEIWRQ